MDYPTSFSLMFFFSWSNVGVRFGRAPRALFLAPEGRPRGQLINPHRPGVGCARVYRAVRWEVLLR